MGFLTASGNQGAGLSLKNKCNVCFVRESRTTGPGFKAEELEQQDTWTDGNSMAVRPMEAEIDAGLSSFFDKEGYCDQVLWQAILSGLMPALVKFQLPVAYES